MSSANLDSSDTRMGYSYDVNTLLNSSSDYSIQDSTGQTYFYNGASNWKNAYLYKSGTGPATPQNYNYTGLNPAPLTCYKGNQCPGIFNINSNVNDPEKSTTNDRVNYLVSDNAWENSDKASVSYDFNNQKDVYRFPYVEASGTIDNYYCFEPNNNGKGCEDGFICAVMDGIVPSEYQTKYFQWNQQSPPNGPFQGPSTNICYGGNFNLVNTNYEDNKKDPIQSTNSPLYPERGVTLYQNPGCNRDNNPDNKNGKYIGGTIKYEGKGVEIFGNCDVCFYNNPLVFTSVNKQNSTDAVYDVKSIDIIKNNNKYGSPYEIYISQICNSYGFFSNASIKNNTVGNRNVFNAVNSRTGTHSADNQAYAGIPYDENNKSLYQCISVIYNDGLVCAIDNIPDTILNDDNINLTGFYNQNYFGSDNKQLHPMYYGIKDDTNASRTLIMPIPNPDKNYNYSKYCGDYGLRILPNEIYTTYEDNIASKDIKSNKLIKGIFADPTIKLNTACDLENSCITGYYSDLVPIPCAPDGVKSLELPYGGNPDLTLYDFNLTTSSIFDGFSSIYIPPHMEVISTVSYNYNNAMVVKVYPKPIRYEDSPFGDGCFPSFHPDDIFGIYGNSLIGISVRVRKDSYFLTTYVNNTKYNAANTTLESSALGMGSVSTFRPDVLLIDLSVDNPYPIPSISEGEYYQIGSTTYPLEHAFNGYVRFTDDYKKVLSGIKKAKKGAISTLVKKVKNTFSKSNIGMEMLYNSIIKMNMNPNIGVFSLEWLYVLYYCAMTNISDSVGGCQATYVNESSGSATGLLGNSYSTNCNSGNMSCLLFNKPYGCNVCNLTGNNMVLATGQTNTCADTIFAESGGIGPSSADQFMSTYCLNLSNKIFPYYFTLYSSGNIDCACISNANDCPWINWKPCASLSDQYKAAQKTGAYLLCALSNAPSTRDCSSSIVDCTNYVNQYGDNTIGAEQTANLQGSCVTLNTSENDTDDDPPPPTTNTFLYIILIVLFIVIIIIAIIGSYFGYRYYKKHKSQQ